METVKRLNINLSPLQSEKLDEWLEGARLIWNEGRSLLIEHELNATANRIDGKTGWVRFPSCQLNQAYFCNEIDGKKVFAPHSWILPKGRKGGTVDRIKGSTVADVVDCDDPANHPHIRVGQCCPVRGTFYREPRLGFDPIGKFTLQYWFTQKNIKAEYGDRPEFVTQTTDIPAWFVRGVCTSLTDAWDRYVKKTGGQPRFKPYYNGIFSLSYGDAKKLNVLIEPEDVANNKKLKGVEYQPGIDGLIQLPKIGWVLVRRMAKEWGDTQILVLELIKNDDGWKAHLTGRKEQHCDRFNVLCLTLHKPLLENISPQLKLAYTVHLSGFTPWQWWRSVDTEIHIQPGSGYVVAKDDRGTEYSVLPRRAKDGALDPHGLIPNLDKDIEYLQKAISKQREHGKTEALANGVPWKPSNRMVSNQRKLRKLQKRRAAILRNSRQKVAHFISERSRSIVVYQAKSTNKRTKKPGKKVVGFDPVQYADSGREQVAERNKREANASPGEFVALLQHEARERMQSIRIEKPTKVVAKTE